MPADFQVAEIVARLDPQKRASTELRTGSGAVFLLQYTLLIYYCFSNRILSSCMNILV